MFDSRDRTSSLTPFSLGVSAALHVALFVLIGAMGQGSCSRRPAEIEVVEVEVVLHENLDRPPDTLRNDPRPKPPAPPPKPEVKKPEPPPKVDEKTDAVKKVAEKPAPPQKKEFKKGQRVDERKPPAKEPPKPPKKDFTKGQRVTGNGPRTERRLSEAEIRKLLAMGAKEGTRNVIAPDELSLGYGNIRRTFFEAWDRPPWRQGLAIAVLEVAFAPGGRVTGVRLVKSSGDAQVDASIRSAAARVSHVPGLTADFIRRCSPVKVEFELTAE